MLETGSFKCEQIQIFYYCFLSKLREVATSIREFHRFLLCAWYMLYKSSCIPLVSLSMIVRSSFG